MRTLAGFFGSVGIANGGGTISDMYGASERAGIFGWYLLGPLLGPTIGPLLGGIIMENLEWRVCIVTPGSVALVKIGILIFVFAVAFLDSLDDLWGSCCRRFLLS